MLDEIDDISSLPGLERLSALTGFEQKLPLDQTLFLTCMRRHINHYIDWNTFSVSSIDGHIYFTPDMILKCFVEQEPETIGLIVNGLSWEERKSLLVQITSEMQDLGIVPDFFVASGYHAGRFRLNFKGCSILKFFTPYRASAFGISLRGLEQEKSPVIRRFQSIQRG